MSVDRKLPAFEIPVVDIPSKFVKQVRLRLSRNVIPYPFLPIMTLEELYNVEKLITIQDFSSMAMSRTSLEDLDREQRALLESKGFWFPQVLYLSPYCTLRLTESSNKISSLRLHSYPSSNIISQYINTSNLHYILSNHLFPSSTPLLLVSGPATFFLFCFVVVDVFAAVLLFFRPTKSDSCFFLLQKIRFAQS